MWHSNVSPTREKGLAVSLSGLGKSEYSSGCDWLNSGRLEGIQFSSAGVDATSVLECFVKPASGKGTTALVVTVGVSLVCGCAWTLSGVFTDDCDWLSDLWYLNDPVLVSLWESIPLV